MNKRQPSPIRIEGASAFIWLGRNMEAAIDISDISLVHEFYWSVLTTATRHVYAFRKENKKLILMHRQLLAPGPKELVDHIDGNGLNNRRNNIRLATPVQNQANRGPDRRNKLGIKGVSLHHGRFQAYISPNGRKMHLGYYTTAEEAAKAHNAAARKLWGDFAKQ